VTAPIALAVHDGNGPLPEHLREIVPAWLRANRVNPDQVSGQHPIHVLTLPYQRPDGEEGLLVQVVVFHQYYVGPDGEQERNLLTGRLACFERTVPLTVAFPSLAPADDEEAPELEGQPEPLADAEDEAETMPEPEAAGAR
jgi:hypothetical protein